ncbi:MAG: hypothetical protein AB1483_08705 [Candidatus Zixiibacteriota bacterium]
MRIILFACAVLLSLSAGVCHGIDFEITDVINIGPVYAGSMLRPVQWSPDGRWIAYFDGNGLRLADTLGVSRAVVKSDFVPMRFRWLGNKEIVVHQRRKASGTESLDRLVTIDIETGDMRVLEEQGNQSSRSALEDGRLFWGLWQTVEGNAYYRVKEQGRTWIEILPREDGKIATADRNHILRAGDDGVYLVRTDFQDSTRISERPTGPYTGHPMSLNRERTHLLFDGTILRLPDDELIALDTISAVRDVYGCELNGGFVSEGMNPVFSEICFVLVCSDVHENESVRVGVFDYSAGQFTILDGIAGLTECHMPEFSPNGRDLTLISNRQLYIVVRNVR